MAFNVLGYGQIELDQTIHGHGDRQGDDDDDLQVLVR